MTVAVAVLGILVAGLILFVLALLRSHAEILRRLATMAEAIDAGATPGSTAGLTVTSSPPPGAGAGGAAAEIRGESLQGDAVKLSLGRGSAPALLAFMGTGCTACGPLWQDLRHGSVPTPAGARLVVITKGPERERLARLLELAPATTDVVMSTRAWEDYTVPSTPHFVLVRDGQIAGRGAATSWEQITGFLTDAADDDRLHTARSLSTEGRAERAERALAEAGIGPDHPSLYPSRAETGHE